MALLNPPQTLPQVMFLIYRYLLLSAEKQTESISTLQSLLAPPSLQGWKSHEDVVDEGDDADVTGAKGGKRPEDQKDHKERDEQKVVRIAYNALREIRVIEQDDDKETAQLNPQLPEYALSRTDGEQHFKRLLRTQILDEAANADIWLEEGSGKIGPRDLTRALAWVLLQNVYEPLNPWKDPSPSSVHRLQQSQLGQQREGWVFSNDTRWDTFVRWASYLGLAWNLGVAKTEAAAAKVVLVPDPTDAVRDALPTLASIAKPKGAKIVLADFLNSLARELPVLDGGVHRNAVLERISAKTLRVPADGEVSSAVAHALFRLKDEGAVSLFNDSDIDKRLFPVESGDLRPYSHIRVERIPGEVGA